MAVRPVYSPRMDLYPGVIIRNIEFKWHPGMSKSQKIKSIRSLHESASKDGIGPILEISSKSEDQLGIDLSAFNLMIFSKTKSFSVETAFQSSKVFENGGPYLDLFEKSSFDAKKDHRLKDSGRLIKFLFFNKEFPLVPQTFFYDWLYINAVHKKFDKYLDIITYNGFTDIEFNPKKSINCQAYSAALFVSLYRFDMLEIALRSTDSFLATLKKEYVSNQRHVGEQKVLSL